MTACACTACVRYAEAPCTCGPTRRTAKGFLAECPACLAHRNKGRQEPHTPLPAGVSLEEQLLTRMRPGKRYLFRELFFKVDQCNNATLGKVVRTLVAEGRLQKDGGKNCTYALMEA